MVWNILKNKHSKHAEKVMFRLHDITYLSIIIVFPVLHFNTHLIDTNIFINASVLHSRYVKWKIWKLNILYFDIHVPAKVWYMHNYLGYKHRKGGESCILNLIFQRNQPPYRKTSNDVLHTLSFVCIWSLTGCYVYVMKQCRFD